MRLGLHATFAVSALASLASANAAHADSAKSWYLHMGAGRLELADEAGVKVGGAAVPGASYSSDAQYTPVFELGYMFTRHIGVSYTFGLPPTVTAEGAGSLAGVGTLGKATYGPMSATVHYHFNPDGRFQPYVGVGYAYMHIFDTQDGALKNLKVDDTSGAAVQVGADYVLTRHVTAFADVKKARLRTEATGTFMGFPAESKMKFDPLVVHVGLGYRF